jgi:hypothetical protein
MAVRHVRHSDRMGEHPDSGRLDKTALIGACARLPLAVDAARLRAEVAALPASYWGTTAGRVGVHRAADAIFLRGHAPAAGDLPIADRPALALLPYVREIIREMLGGQPLRCLLARLPAGASIAPHIDRAPYFQTCLRIHIPVESHDRAWMVCGGMSYIMRPGEVWALNNGDVHAVWNAHPTLPRTHLICDFEPAAAMLDLLLCAERNLGHRIAEVDEYLAKLPRPGAGAGAGAGPQRGPGPG